MHAKKKRPFDASSSALSHASLMASPLDAALVQRAVAALFTHLAKERAGKSALFEEEDMFSLVVALEKTPQHGSVKAHRMCAPPGAAAAAPRPHTPRRRKRAFAWIPLLRAVKSR